MKGNGIRKLCKGRNAVSFYCSWFLIFLFSDFTGRERETAREAAAFRNQNS
jgi:hypothetical protein